MVSASVTVIENFVGQKAELVIVPSGPPGALNTDGEFVGTAVASAVGLGVLVGSGVLVRVGVMVGTLGTKIVSPTTRAVDSPRQLAYLSSSTEMP